MEENTTSTEDIDELENAELDDLDKDDDEERIIDVDELDPTNATTLDDIYDLMFNSNKNISLGDI